MSLEKEGKVRDSKARQSSFFCKISKRFVFFLVRLKVISSSKFSKIIFFDRTFLEFLK